MKMKINIILCLSIICILFGIVAFANEKAVVSIDLSELPNGQADNILLARDIEIRDGQADKFIVVGQPIIDKKTGVLSIEIPDEFEVMENEIHVRIPEYYTSFELDPVEVTLTHTGQCCEMNGEQWFTISDLHTAKEGEVKLPEGTAYFVEVSAIANKDLIPRLPTLVVDGQQYYGDGVMYFDEEGLFEKASYMFLLPEGITVDNDSAFITVSDAYLFNEGFDIICPVRGR